MKMYCSFSDSRNGAGITLLLHTVGAFHSPVEYQRILSLSLDRAHKARFETAKVLAQLGFTGDVPLPDISTKEKAQAYIGLDMQKEKTDKKNISGGYYPSMA